MVILVIWSFVKIENRKSKSATIIINIHIYLIVSNDRVSEIDFDHFDHDHFVSSSEHTAMSPIIFVTYLCTILSVNYHQMKNILTLNCV